MGPAQYRLEFIRYTFDYRTECPRICFANFRDRKADWSEPSPVSTGMCIIYFSLQDGMPANLHDVSFFGTSTSRNICVLRGFLDATSRSPSVLPVQLQFGPQKELKMSLGIQNGQGGSQDRPPGGPEEHQRDLQRDLPGPDVTIIEVKRLVF